MSKRWTFGLFAFLYVVAVRSTPREAFGEIPMTLDLKHPYYLSWGVIVVVLVLSVAALVKHSTRAEELYVIIFARTMNVCACIFMFYATWEWLTADPWRLVGYITLGIILLTCMFIPLIRTWQREKEVLQRWKNRFQYKM